MMDAKGRENHMSITGENAVREAAAYLDKVAAQGNVLWLTKDWRDRIDLNTLDIESCGYCILAQLEGGSYDNATRDLSDVADLPDLSPFASHQGEWVQYLTDTANGGVDTTGTWYEKANNRAVKDLQNVRLNNKPHVAFMRSDGTVGLYLAEDFMCWYERLAPCPFKGGDVLQDQDGDFFLFASADRVIRMASATWDSYSAWISAPTGRTFKKNIWKSADQSSMWANVKFDA